MSSIKIYYDDVTGRIIQTDPPELMPLYQQMGPYVVFPTVYKWNADKAFQELMCIEPIAVSQKIRMDRNE
jgi:hypothetical protein